MSSCHRTREEYNFSFDSLLVSLRRVAQMAAPSFRFSPFYTEQETYKSYALVSSLSNRIPLSLYLDDTAWPLYRLCVPRDHV
jgi:hypothetical protein